MFYCTSAYSSSLVKNRAAESTSPPQTTHRTSFNGTNEEETTQKRLFRPDKGSQLRWSLCFATGHACAEENRRRMVVGTGRLYPTQTSETSFQETTRRRGWSTSAVADRSRRLVEFEKRQRRHDLFPQTLQTDQGVEFINRTVQALLKKNGIHHFSTHNAETKASIVERFNRTYKTRMWRYFTKHQTWRYIDVLQDLVQSYNNSPHRSIGMAPSQVSAKNQEDVWQLMYGHDGKGVPKFRVCRIACASISSRDCSKKATWRIGAKKRYSRYTRFIPPIHSESVLQRRKVGIRTEALVKWYG